MTVETDNPMPAMVRLRWRLLEWLVFAVTTVFFLFFAGAAWLIAWVYVTMAGKCADVGCAQWRETAATSTVLQFGSLGLLALLAVGVAWMLVRPGR